MAPDLKSKETMANDDNKTDQPKIAVNDFASLMKRAVSELGIPEEQISSLSSVKSLKNVGKTWTQRHSAVLVAGISFLIIFGVPSSIYASIKQETRAGEFFVRLFFAMMGWGPFTQEMCIFGANEYVQDPFRPPVNCQECRNVTGIHWARNLSHEEFLEKYAFSMQPVLIKDGQEGWTASKMFSFNFFREVYQEGSEALEKVTRDCQFFPYQTEFLDLGEMLNMSRDRIEGKGKPWYVGWSNCDGKAANILRKHYKFPYFLPPELDHSKTDWVFMGLPGYGANMHIDFVGTLSWQAQVKGTKKWILEAPPECAGICVSSMEIIVEPGDIIVLDTNKWFHATEILGNETSIVIGSEYY